MSNRKASWGRLGECEVPDCRDPYHREAYVHYLDEDGVERIACLYCYRVFVRLEDPLLVAETEEF